LVSGQPIELRDRPDESTPPICSENDVMYVVDRGDIETATLAPAVADARGISYRSRHLRRHAGVLA
jgi:hypothetical protein